MATKGFITKRSDEAFPLWVSFANNITAPEVISSQSVTAVDSLGDPATATVIDSSSIDGADKVKAEVKAGVDGETYTITFQAVTSLAHTYSLQVDMAVDDSGDFEDQLDSMDTKLTSISSGVSATEAKVDAVKLKTDNLPESPADQGTLEEIQLELADPDQYKANVSLLALESTAQDIKAKTDNIPENPAVQATSDAIKLKTDNLPFDPADQSLVDSAVRDAKMEVLDSVGTVNGMTKAIKFKTDNLPDDPASQEDVQEMITNTEESLAEDIELVQTTTDAINVKVAAIQLKTDTIKWSDVEFVAAIEGGRWKIEGSQMLFYAADNTTPIATFNLFKANGDPAITPEDMYERRRV